MFVTNSQLFNKITVLENKINRLNKCCDCKSYEQLKEYLDIKLNEQLNEYLDIKITNSNSTQINNSEIEKYNNETQYIMKNLKDEMKNISLQIEFMTEKMGSLYFENEIFKHQLSLEDDIRKSMDEIDTITNIINDSVYEIDVLLNTIYIKKIE